MDDEMRERNEAIVAALAAREPAAAVAQRFGLSPSRVYRIGRENEIASAAGNEIASARKDGPRNDVAERFVAAALRNSARMPTFGEIFQYPPRIDFAWNRL